MMTPAGTLTCPQPSPTGTVAVKIHGTAAAQKHWQYPLSEAVIGEYVAVPLTSAQKLKKEAARMDNRYRDFIGPCSTHEYAVFSLRRRSGERLATLGLKQEDGHWYFDQCAGPCGEDVLEVCLAYLDEEDELQSECYPTELYFIAHEVVRLMNAGSRMH